jgi:SNF family Na+-dependent transporter
MGIPLLFIEWGIGRYGGQYGHHTTPFAFQRMNRASLWKYIGVFGIFSNVAIAAYYCYIESWTMSYVYHSIVGTFSGLDQHQVAAFFSNYLDISTSTTGIPYEAVLFFVLCLLLNTWILSRGLSKGIETVAKIGMPLLILFGIFLAIKGITLKSGSDGAINDGFVGLNFLWTPHFDSLSNPKVWLAAAGQIFFTLSLGQGSVQCYASYVRKKDDIALNSMSAGWMNEFVEVVLGSAIIIPISIGYLGIDRVIELTAQGGLGLGFRTMPFLFQQWGQALGAIAGVAFFGLLFFAGITSSLAMGTPVLSFLRDEFNWRRKPAAWAFGVIVLILGLPTVFFFQYGVFDEYDYWAGTVSLVTFAMLEAILFAWVFGLKKGWPELTHGADIRLFTILKPVLKFITPVILILVFTGSLLRPANDDWASLFNGTYKLHNESIIGQVLHQGKGPNRAYFADAYYSESTGVIDTLYSKDGIGTISIASFAPDGTKNTKDVTYGNDDTPVVKPGEKVCVGSKLYAGSVTNNILFVDLSRLLLTLVFVGISLMVYAAFRKRKKEGSF